MNGPECHPQAPVAEGGPVGFSTGGTDGTGSLGVRGSEDGIQDRSYPNYLRLYSALERG